MVLPGSAHGMLLPSYTGRAGLKTFRGDSSRSSSCHPEPMERPAQRP